jgi:2'-5' RNA ligase
LAEPGIQKLFFALWPDQTIREGLLRIGRELPPHGGHAPHPPDLHLTLVFLGPVTAEQYPCVVRAAAAIRGVPFDLTIDRVGYWSRPRILWCAPAETPEPLQTLVADLQRELLHCGFRPEKRPYSPHVTLARKSRPVEFQLLSESLSWPAREFVLVASGPGGEPPRYRILERWPLLVTSS